MKRKKKKKTGTKHLFSLLNHLLLLNNGHSRRKLNQEVGVATLGKLAYYEKSMLMADTVSQAWTSVKAVLYTGCILNQINGQSWLIWVIKLSDEDKFIPIQWETSE